MIVYCIILLLIIKIIIIIIIIIIITIIIIAVGLSLNYWFCDDGGDVVDDNIDRNNSSYCFYYGSVQSTVMVRVIGMMLVSYVNPSSYAI